MTILDPVSTGNSDRDMAQLRRLYGRYPTGVAAVCALRDGQPVGIVATSFTPVSIDPALVSICVQHTSTTWPHLADGRHLGVSVLASRHEAACRQIAAKNVDRFAGVSWFATESDAVLLSDAVAHLDCEISTTVSAGDHDVVILEVKAAAADLNASPLVFHDSRFRTFVVGHDS
ncbi:flavin reductase family protein [Mycolicibacterium mucogenicum]|uniref:flavin reductase family protein n=1 Tax=Mycolicibacterium mucogenicum TaxID=56689 RepID=UPI00226997E0|nr:flavin reductase family protein [Mycolicibacterium mucogenicum]MCX8560547.1 flavin reductase family protein [Mycolicibacterium mucogenicum]